MPPLQSVRMEPFFFSSAERTGPGVWEHKGRHPPQLSRQTVDMLLSDFIPENLELYAEQITQSFSFIWKG